MKTIPTLFFSTLLMLFSVNQAISQEKYEIILSVDTDKFSIQNMDDTCSFGQGDEICNECYTVEVEKGDTVIWKGKSSSSEEDTVEITSIKYSNGTDLFNNKELRASNGEVTGTIAKGNAGQYLKYDIYFKLYRSGNYIGEFSIDPKLRMRRLR
jgi:hypothetical protein